MTARMARAVRLRTRRGSDAQIPVPGSGFEATMTSPMFGFSEQYRFEQDQGGNRVSMSAAVEPHGVFRFLSPIMTAGVRHQVRADHRRLKTVLEHPPSISEPEL